MVLAINLLGDWQRDALTPKLQRGRAASNVVIRICSDTHFLKEVDHAQDYSGVCLVAWYAVCFVAWRLPDVGADVE
jgi:hypothetical protein